MELGERDFRDAIMELLPVLRAQARILTGARDTADDLLQEVVLRMLRAGVSRPPLAELRPWAFVVLRNTWRSELRRQRRAARMVEAQPREEAVPPSDPDAQRQLADALAKLPPAQREALAVSALGAESLAQAAALWGISPGTLRARASRARAALRALLAP